MGFDVAKCNIKERAILKLFAEIRELVEPPLPQENPLKRKIGFRNSDNDMPMGKLVRVKDFLPPPHELVFPERTVKVTISLNQSSVEFFKRQARKHRAKYQKMIRELLDYYASNYSAA